MNNKQRIKQALNELLATDKRVIVLDNITEKDIRVKCHLRILFNKFIITLSGKIPPSRIKNWLVRRTGVKLGKDVCLPMDIYFDVYFPELIEVKDNTLIGGYNHVFSHELIDGKLKLGKVKIGKSCLVGGMSRTYPGVYIADNVLVGGRTIIREDCLENTFIGGGKEQKTIKMLDKGWNNIERSSTKQYYKELRKAVKKFLKDPNHGRYLHIDYKGKRGNAGCDWYKGRNWLHIYLTSAWIEFWAFFGPSKFKNMMLRLTGAKIGRNVKIEKSAFIEHIYPEMVTIEDNVTVKSHAYIDGHDFLVNRSSVFAPILKKGCVIGEHSNVYNGSIVGENSIVKPWTFVNRDVPPNNICEGTPGKCRPIEK